MKDTPLRRRLRLDQSLVMTQDPSAVAVEPVDERSAMSVRGVVREMLETAIFVLLIFLIVRGVVQNFKIEGQSMEPNLHSGQYILVNKIVYFHFDMNAPLRLLPGNDTLSPMIVYPFRRPHRGDVVVFEYPRDFSKDYIKRVIGVEGDIVEIRDGAVFVNGDTLDEAYLQGVSTTCRIDDRCAQGPITVQPGSIFVLGDNRNNSSDSREWDELPLDRVIGQAWVSYWPQEYWGVIPTPIYAAP
jgi:signal peptidase I